MPTKKTAGTAAPEKKATKTASAAKSATAKKSVTKKTATKTETKVEKTDVAAPEKKSEAATLAPRKKGVLFVASEAFPYAGSNTNALIKHATTAVSTVPTAIPITACFLLLTDL